MSRRRKQEGQRKARDERSVQKDGRCSGSRKALIRVEHARDDGDEGDEEKIGKGDARQRDGKLELLRILREAGRKKRDDERHREQRDDEECHLDEEHQRRDAVGKGLRGRRAFRLEQTGIGRNEGVVERALAEYGAEMVRDAQRHDECVSHRPDAHHRGDDDIAQEPGDARDERPTAD